MQAIACEKTTGIRHLPSTFEKPRLRLGGPGLQDPPGGALHAAAQGLLEQGPVLCADVRPERNRAKGTWLALFKKVPQKKATVGNL